MGKRAESSNFAMTNCAIYGIPFLCLGFLVTFAGILWPWQARSPSKDRGGVTTEHSDRIYKDFEMCLKVMLGLTTAFGYVRLNVFDKQPVVARQALVGIGAISLLVMLIFCIFVICHQGSKLRRWSPIEWPKIIFWQEIWACAAMYVYSVGLWIAAFRW